MVEFEGERRPLESVWSDELARLVGPLKSTVENALDKAADPDELKGLMIIVYTEVMDAGAQWGFKFAGPPTAVNYAVSLVGQSAPVIKPHH